jgi:ABC-type multidrug transport system ATPase subunit
VGHIPHAVRVVRQLPLGVVRRVDLGCAVIDPPEVLFLDPPFEGLNLAERS